MFRYLRESNTKDMDRYARTDGNETVCIVQSKCTKMKGGVAQPMAWKCEFEDVAPEMANGRGMREARR